MRTALTASFLFVPLLFQLCFGRCGEELPLQLPDVLGSAHVLGEEGVVGVGEASQAVAEGGQQRQWANRRRSTRVNTARFFGDLDLVGAWVVPQERAPLV